RKGSALAALAGIALALPAGCGRAASSSPRSATLGTGAVVTVVPSETDARVSRVEELLRGVPGLEVTALANGAYQIRIRGPGTIEVGGFARYVDFDNTLPMGDDMGVGGRVGVYLEPALALELDLARSSQSSVTYTPLHLRAVYIGAVSPRLDALVGGGYVRNWYGAPYSAADQGLSLLLGLRYHLRSQVWLRLGADLDVMFHTADNTLFTFYNGTR